MYTRKRLIFLEEKRKTFLGCLKLNYKLWVGTAKFNNSTYPLRKDFLQWASNDPIYNNLYKAWKQENFSVDALPAVDHIHIDKGYDLDNLIWRRADIANEIYMEDVKKKFKNKWEQRREANPTLHAYCTWNNILKRYGIDRKTWDELLIKSNGKCMLMGEQFKNPRDCHIDHDHKTGKVRGLLCARCNHLLAGIDNLEFRESAFIYLEHSKIN